MGLFFSRSYVRHLFNINEILGLRIASTLNLVYYNDLIIEVREQINNGTFEDWAKTTLGQMYQKRGM